MCKRSFIVWLVILVVVLIFMSGQAEEYEEYPSDLNECDGFYYAIKDDNTAEIFSWNGYDSNMNDLTIPYELDGYQVTSINQQGQFYSGDTYSLTIPDCLTEIPTDPFVNMFELTRIEVSPDHPTLASIDGILYSKSDKRLVSYPRAIVNESFQVPDNIRSIGDYAFSCARNLQAVVLPNSIESIGSHAFEGAVLSGIALPESLVRIGDSAFSDCNELQTVEIQDSCIQIGDSAFTACGSLRSFYVSADNSTFASIDGVLYNKVEKMLIDFPAGNGMQSFTVPDGVLAIGDHAFQYCHDLFMVELPDSCTSIHREAFYGCESLNTIMLSDALLAIEDNAFFGCDFSRIWLPESLVEIGANPFSYCYQLSEIEVSPESEHFATIDNVLFNKDKKLLICYPYGLTYESYQIPNGIKGIGDYAFSGNGYLQLVTIPETVESIAEHAFDYVYLKLQVTRDTYAAQYCKEHDLDYVYTDADDWLNS